LPRSPTATSSASTRSCRTRSRFYDVDEHGQRAAKPYRQWDLPAGPWLLVKFADTGAEYAIWKPTGAIYEVDPGGAVGEDPVAL
jgi:hypothetical protein